ncbi:zinc ribbon domain-containing protein, partial [Desulfocurvibacter africanus]|uniref:zinc ribbon domain-containing protein n=1 Tax=Desulfocurvibacter africanus TaxID=873 RepID=UPI002FDA86CA
MWRGAARSGGATPLSTIFTNAGPERLITNERSRTGEGDTTMPLFDFHCGRCGHVFEDIAKADDMPACPKCGSAANRQLAAPSSLTGKTRSALPGPTGHG